MARLRWDFFDLACLVALVCVSAVEVGDVTTIPLPYDSWCAYRSVYIPEDDKLFMSGGYTRFAVDVFTSTKVRYAALVDLASGTAIAIDDKPTATGKHHPSVYYDDKIYTLGAPMEVYDLVTASWSSGPGYPLTFEYAPHVCTIYISTVVCAGGYKNMFYGNAYTLELSDSTPQWTSLPSLSDSRIFHGMVAHNGYVYVIGGYCAHYCYSKSVERLDLSSPTSWLSMSESIPSARLAPLCTTANGMLYVISGVFSTYAHDTRKIVHSYTWAEAKDPITSWTETEIDMGSRECQIYCDATMQSGDMAYYSSTTGVTTLTPGSVSSIELRTIVVLPCDASAPIKNGDIGDCTSSLASGSTCQPTCNSGYTISGTSSCSAGTLTAATCSADLCDALFVPCVDTSKLKHWFDFSNSSVYGSAEVTKITGFHDKMGNSEGNFVRNNVQYKPDAHDSLGAVYVDTGSRTALEFSTTHLGRNPEMFIAYKTVCGVDCGLTHGHLFASIDNGYEFGTYTQDTDYVDNFGSLAENGGRTSIYAPYGRWHAANVYYGENEPNCFFFYQQRRRKYIGNIWHQRAIPC